MAKEHQTFTTKQFVLTAEEEEPKAYTQKRTH